MSDILEKIEWASNTHKDKLMFGLNEKDAAIAREHRLHGVLIDCKEEIKILKEQLAEYKSSYELEKRIFDKKVSELEADNKRLYSYHTERWDKENKESK